jgi:hypothetical protein
MRFERCAQECFGCQFLSAGKPSPREIGKQNRICRKRFRGAPVGEFAAYDPGELHIPLGRIGKRPWLGPQTLWRRR